MLIKKLGFLFLLFIPLIGLAQEETIDIDVSSFCKDEAKLEKQLGPVHCLPEINSLNDLQKNVTEILNPTGLNAQEIKKSTCQSILELEKQKLPALELKLKDDEGNPWKIRFHFGHSRMYGSIKPTDVKIQSSRVNTIIRGFQFDERTSNSYYNPWKWDRSVLDAAKWIDEPSNSFIFSIENKKNAFYLTAYHPKLLNTYYESVDADGVATYTPTQQYISNGTTEAFAAIPSGQRALEIQNTHQYMVYQVGYGRKFTVFEGKKPGHLSLIPRADVGVTVGAARAIIVEEGQWSDKYDKLKIQGTNASVGGRLEYQRGKVGVFVEKKWTFSKNEVGFMDGTATYDLQYSPTTIGVNIDLITLNKKKKSKVK